MNLWAVLTTEVMRANWLLAVPHVMETTVAILSLSLAALLWPRGCCEKDDLFSRKAF